MALSIYKPGQGKWVRLGSAIGFGLLIVAGAAWIYEELTIFQSPNLLYIQLAVSLSIILGFGGLLWWLLNKPNIVEFMIATEAEMRKVNWPTQREITGSTWVVILGTIFLAVAIYLADIACVYVFQKIGILATG